MIYTCLTAILPKRTYQSNTKQTTKTLNNDFYGHIIFVLHEDQDDYETMSSLQYTELVMSLICQLRANRVQQLAGVNRSYCGQVSTNRDSQATMSYALSYILMQEFSLW